MKPIHHWSKVLNLLKDHKAKTVSSLVISNNESKTHVFAAATLDLRAMSEAFGLRRHSQSDETPDVLHISSNDHNSGLAAFLCEVPCLATQHMSSNTKLHIWHPQKFQEQVPHHIRKGGDNIVAVLVVGCSS